MGHTTRRWSAIGVIASVLLIAPGTAVWTQQAPIRRADLATILTPGDLLQDRNGDGAVDFVNARIPGAVTAAATLEELRGLAEEMLALHVEGMIADGELIPGPTSLDDITRHPDYRSAVAVLVAPAPAEAAGNATLRPSPQPALGDGFPLIASRWSLDRRRDAPAKRGWSV